MYLRVVCLVVEDIFDFLDRFLGQDGFFNMGLLEGEEMVILDVFLRQEINRKVIKLENGNFSFGVGGKWYFSLSGVGKIGREKRKKIWRDVQ